MKRCVSLKGVSVLVIPATQADSREPTDTLSLPIRHLLSWSHHYLLHCTVKTATTYSFLDGHLLNLHIKVCTSSANLNFGAIVTSHCKKAEKVRLCEQGGPKFEFPAH